VSKGIESNIIVESDIMCSVNHDTSLIRIIDNIFIHF